MRRDPSSKEVMSPQCKYKAAEGRLDGVYGAVDVATDDLTEKRTRNKDYGCLHGHAEGCGIGKFEDYSHFCCVYSHLCYDMEMEINALLSFLV